MTESDPYYYACQTKGCENNGIPIATFGEDFIPHVESGEANCGLCHNRLARVKAPGGKRG